MTELPHSYQWIAGQRVIVFLVPKFHLPAHILACQIAFSFNYTKNAARTDGEAPERGWGNINGAAGMTQEMGPGARRDTLDDFLGDWNWKKVSHMGTSFNLVYSSSLTLGRSCNASPQVQIGYSRVPRPCNDARSFGGCFGTTGCDRMARGGGGMGE